MARKCQTLLKYVWKVLNVHRVCYCCILLASKKQGVFSTLSRDQLKLHCANKMNWWATHHHSQQQVSCSPFKHVPCSKLSVSNLQARQDELLSASFQSTFTHAFYMILLYILYLCYLSSPCYEHHSQQLLCQSQWHNWQQVWWELFIIGGVQTYAGSE